MGQLLTKAFNMGARCEFVCLPLSLPPPLVALCSRDADARVLVSGLKRRVFSVAIGESIGGCRRTSSDCLCVGWSSMSCVWWCRGGEVVILFGYGFKCTNLNLGGVWIVLVVGLMGWRGSLFSSECLGVISRDSLQFLFLRLWSCRSR